MVKETKYEYVGRAGAPDYTSGGQGDCVWQSADTIIPGISGPGFRKDRFGRVHLAGVAPAGNGLGGDATCSTSETEDGIMCLLPAAGSELVSGRSAHRPGPGELKLLKPLGIG